MSRSEGKLIRGLSRRKVRDSEGLFLAEGVRVVEELLRAGLSPALAAASPVLEETERGRELLGRLEQVVAVRRVSHADLLDLSDTRTSQGILVAADIPRQDLHQVAVRGRATALVLDAVQDPGNAGTMARSAAAFGCEALICLPGTVDPWNPKVVRASAGALFRFPVVAVDTAGAAEWLAAGGFGVLGADAGGDPVEGLELPSRTALVVGNEGAGIGDAARALCSRLVSVPMQGGTESLNVSVVAGILLYLVARGRA